MSLAEEGRLPGWGLKLAGYSPQSWVTSTFPAQTWDEKAFPWVGGCSLCP